MGVPLSNYTALKYLADGSEKSRTQSQSIEMELALDALENYSVFAFILHDPTVHQDFHELFEKQFKNLHYSSGKHLVFFGLVDSPQNYRLIGERPFYSDVREMMESYENELNHEFDPTYTAFAIANSLNIQPDMLPAIVVTHDTRMRSYRWYRTCPDKLETQMNRLTGISNQMNTYKKNDRLSLDEKQKILNELLDEQDLDLCKGAGTTKLNESMARALSDLMSFLIEEEHDNHSFRKSDQFIQRIARSQRNISLNKVKQNLTILQSTIKNVDSVEGHIMGLIEDLNIKLATYLAIMNQKKSKEDYRPSFLNQKWFESHSLFLLQTGMEVKSYLQTKVKAVDYSPSAICFAKMFEQEINYSIVHWIRKQKSIILPDYFNKVQPNVKALVKPHFKSGIEGFTVDFNKKSKNGTWQPPELGKTKVIAENNITTDNWRSIGISKPEEFLKEWHQIYLIRNKAAHTEKVSLVEINNVENAFSKLAEYNLLEEMATIKRSFQNKLV
ncbi:hypothetical protein [Bacillus sp. Marseille-P3661]|uniref:hypothetical protein n=1 Tax=Bacillus sp. Marseille-P3661 TaxID=1936234 RepID=UPI000C81E926|nr:hypothetical protein [Bacillus sp. Marseille-P3661]